MSGVAIVICFAIFCVVLYLIMNPKNGQSDCSAEETGNQSPKEAMMSRAPLAIVNLNDTPSTPKDTLELVKQGCDVQTVATPWSYVKSITHVGPKGSSINIDLDQYFDRCDSGEVSTRPIVGGKRNDSSRNPEYHKEKPKAEKEEKSKEAPPANPPANQSGGGNRKNNKK